MQESTRPETAPERRERLTLQTMERILEATIAHAKDPKRRTEAAAYLAKMRAER